MTTAHQYENGLDDNGQEVEGASSDQIARELAAADKFENGGQTVHCPCGCVYKSLALSFDMCPDCGKPFSCYMHPVHPNSRDTSIVGAYLRSRGFNG